MRISRRQFMALPAVYPLIAAPTAPSPYGAFPSTRQLHWHELEFYGFLHFTVNTFTDKEWGYGDEDPSLFSPTAFDADAIVEGLKSAGMAGVILTCKHHDGFCLWPTRTTDHSVRASRWRNGKGDVVRDLSDAASRHGLKFGVYVSPWDRNNASYGSAGYLKLYRDQLRELLTEYGPVFELWHDGANGGDGFYGGAREKRTIDKRTYYDWPRTWDLVRSLQPNAVIFSDVGPDIRWVGNERGYANDPCWETYDPVAPDGGAPAPGLTRGEDGQTGTRHGSRWLPPECDVSIRPGWFWHEKENARVKTPAQLLDLYYRSVGRGGSLLLNVPPDRRGLLHENDLASLNTLGATIHKTFAQNLATKAQAKASNIRANQKLFGAHNLLDGDRNTYWSTGDAIKTAGVTLTFHRDIRFNVIRLREAIALGQRIDGFELDCWRDGAWITFTKGTSIGATRLIRTNESVTTSRLRLRITEASASIALSDFGLFLE
jgi:alpha-L-fucosidase